MKYRGIFEYEYPTEHKPPVSIDVQLHGDCVKGKIIEWEYRPLEQEPITKNDLEVDCISRADVLKLMQDNWHTHDGDWAMQESMDDIRVLPSVTPQEQRWIPASERLPKDKETVLVTFKHQISGKTIGLGSVVVLRGKPHWHVREQNLGTYDVTAWMPLPKPYEPQESEG